MNTVQQIYDKLSAITQSKMGVSAQRLAKVFEPEKNDLRNIELAWGVRHGPASPDTDAIKRFVLVQKFDIILSDSAANRNNDSDIQTRLNNLYSKADDIFKECIKLKLENYLVTQVNGLEFLEPQVLANGAILLTAGIDVHYHVDPYST